MTIYVNGIGMGATTLDKALDRYDMRGRVTPEQVVETSRFYGFDKDSYLTQRELNGSVSHAKVILDQEHSPSVLESVKKRVFGASTSGPSDFEVLTKAHHLNDDYYADRYELEMAANCLKRGDGTTGFTYKGRLVESDRAGWKVDGRDVGTMRYEMNPRVGPHRSITGIWTEKLGPDCLFKSEAHAVRGLIDAGIV